MTTIIENKNRLKDELGESRLASCASTGFFISRLKLDRLEYQQLACSIIMNLLY